jgi:hypothetical protein
MRLVQPVQQFLLHRPRGEAVYFGPVASSQDDGFFNSFNTQQLPDSSDIIRWIHRHALPDFYRCSVVANTYSEQRHEGVMGLI